MNPNEIQQQARQSAQQGQDMLNSYVANQNQYKGQYNDFTNQASQANQSLKDYLEYMKGAGSGTNLYNTGLTNAFQSQGFNPATLATATSNLTQSQNAQAALNQASQSSTGGYGLSGGQLGGYYASAAQPLANQVQTQSNAVGNLQQLYQNALTQANQYAGVGVQGEQATQSGLSQIFQNAQTQASTALSQMQFYAKLASEQGGLNATNQQAYDTAIQSYQQAQAAAAQAGLFAAQTAGQRISNQAAQQQLDTSTPGTPAFNAAQNANHLKASQAVMAAAKTQQPIQPAGWNLNPFSNGSFLSNLGGDITNATQFALGRR